MTEAEVRVIMEQSLLALDFMHKKRIIHRDIKPDNILVKSRASKEGYEIKVADLGLALFTENDELLGSKCGTPGYIAPEIFSGEGYSYKVDIFSLGSTFFNLLTGRYLFAAENHCDVLRKNAICHLSGIASYLSDYSA